MIEKALKQAIEALGKCKAALAEELGAWDIDPPLHHILESHDACGPAITSLKQAIADLEKQEPVELPSDDEIHDAAYAAYCRGPNTRELFRIMWTCNPPPSIGWDRDELKSFARQIASLYTSPPQRQWVGLTDEDWKTLFLTTNAETLPKAIEAKLKEKNHG
jgi:hypothetical protein